MKGTSFFVTWIVFGSPEGRRSDESEGVVKVQKSFSEATEMASGSRYGV